NLDFRADHPREPIEPIRRISPVAAPGTDLQQLVSRIVLEEFAPAAVVVTGDMQIVHVQGDTGKYLQPARGQATLNILKMAREGLMFELRSAIHAARRNNAPARKEGIRIKQNGHFGEVNLEVLPLMMAGV